MTMVRNVMPSTAQVHARAAAAAVEPAQLLRDAARAATAAAARVDAPAVYSETESGDAARPLSGKPPRAPPRGRPGAAAVPGRRRVLDGSGRKNRKKKKEGGEPEPTPAAAQAAQAVAAGSAGLQPGERHGRVGGEKGAASGASGAHAAAQQGACKEGSSGAHRAQAPGGQDAALRERAERKRLKKQTQKLRRAAGGLSEEQAALERARRERKKQRLKAARTRKAKPVAA